MKIKNIKWILGLCFFQCTFGYAQQAGILLIKQKEPFRKVVLKKGKYLKIKHGTQYQQSGLVLINKDKPKKNWQINKGKVIKISHFSNGQLVVTKGILEGKTTDFIKISPMTIPVYYNKNKDYQQNFVPQIPINNILYIKPKRSAGKDFISMIGYIIAIPSVLSTVSSFVDKSSFISPKFRLSAGVIGLSLGGTIIWSARKRKYKIQGGPWVIN